MLQIENVQGWWERHWHRWPLSAIQAAPANPREAEGAPWSRDSGFPGRLGWASMESLVLGVRMAAVGAAGGVEQGPPWECGGPAGTTPEPAPVPAMGVHSVHFQRAKSGAGSTASLTARVSPPSGGYRFPPPPGDYRFPPPQGRRGFPPPPRGRRFPLHAGVTGFPLHAGAAGCPPPRGGRGFPLHAGVAGFLFHMGVTGLLSSSAAESGGLPVSPLKLRRE